MTSSSKHPARAIEVNIAIVRTFVELRRLMDSNRHLARKRFAIVFDAIKRLVAEDEARKAAPKRRIGFVTG